MPTPVQLVADQNFLYPSLAGSVASATDVVGPVDVANASGVIIAIHGTYAGVTVNFEAQIDSDPTWYPVQAVNMDGASTPATSAALASNASKAYQIELAGATSFRVRASAWTSGSATVTIVAVAEMPDPVIYAQVFTQGTTTIGTVLGPAPTFGYPTASHFVSAATTNSTNVKASQGSVGSIDVQNTSAAIKYLKLYNKATAPTVGTDTPLMTIGVPANGHVTIEPASGIKFNLGIGFAMTGASSDADTTAVAAGDLVFNIVYV